MSRASGTPRAGSLDYRAPASAGLERCLTATGQSERSATFVGRMMELPAGSGMSMRIGIEVRDAGEGAFHRLEGAGSSGRGSWRSAEPGVKIFKDVKQVTNLAGPVDYRAVVRFRWTNSKGVTIRHEVLRTPVCHEPASEGQVGEEAANARMT